MLRGLLVIPHLKDDQPARVYESRSPCLRNCYSIVWNIGEELWRHRSRWIRWRMERCDCKGLGIRFTPSEHLRISILMSTNATRALQSRRGRLLQPLVALTSVLRQGTRLSFCQSSIPRTMLAQRPVADIINVTPS